MKEELDTAGFYKQVDDNWLYFKTVDELIEVGEDVNDGDWVRFPSAPTDYLKWLEKTRLWSLHVANVALWRSDLGDEILRLCYALDHNSIVYDLGGYLGDWSKEISDRYASNIHVFEPVPKFANAIKSRLGRHRNVHVHELALGSLTSDVYMDEHNDASMIGNGVMCVRQVDIREWMSNVDRIDLMKINVEGTEYDIIPAMVESGDILKVDNIQVQFHWFVEDAQERLVNIREMLSITHKCTWSYDFVWENWEKRKDI